MKWVALCLVIDLVLGVGVEAREGADVELGTRSIAEGYFTHFEPQADEFSLANAYLSAHAIQVTATDKGADILAEDHFIQVVEVAGAAGKPRVVLAANREMILVTFARPHHASIAKFWKFLQVGLTDGSGWEGEGCKIHSGSAAGIDEIWDGLVMELMSMRGGGQPIWLTGHGLGGSLAVLAAYRLAGEEGLPIRGIYTFGQPKVGNMGFARRFGEVLAQAEDGSPLYRLVNDGDIVPRLKPPYVATRRLVTDTLSPYVDFGALLFLQGAGVLTVNPGNLEALAANLFDLKDSQNHEMATYQDLLSECLDEGLQRQLPKPVLQRRGKKVYEY